MKVRVRFAPSPTGFLHLGGARTALFNYLFAKQNKGKFILRIEDTDVTRHQTSAQKEFLESLNWLGIQWDEGPDIGGEYGPYISSQCNSIYKEEMSKLLKKKKAYPCFCSEEKLNQLRKKAAEEGKAFIYPGICRNLNQDEINELLTKGENAVYRFRVPKGKTLNIADLVRGNISFSTDDLNDFVICKANKQPLYNFASVIDDARMKITHVIRGEEHLSNTPLQILLYETLGYNQPAFAHLPLIFNKSGRKLSKRDENVDQFINIYREKGYLPSAVINFLVLLGWSPNSEEEFFSKSELISLFSLNRIGRAGAIFDNEKLKWMNGQYIKKADEDQITKLTIPYFQKAGFIDKTTDIKKIKSVVTLFKESVYTISEISDNAKSIFHAATEPEQDAGEILKNPESLKVIYSFLEKIQKTEDDSITCMRNQLKNVQKETGFRGKKLFLPIRAAITGCTEGPDLPALLHCLGREEILNRSRMYLKTPKKIFNT